MGLPPSCCQFVKLRKFSLSLSLFLKGFETWKIIFYFLCNCFIPNVIRSFTRLSKFITIAWRSSHFEAYFYTRILLLSSSEIRLHFVSALWTSSDVLVANRLRVLSGFQLQMKFYSFDDILHCFSRSLRWSIQSNRFGSIWLASEMNAKEEYSLKFQGNHHMLCPFHNLLGRFQIFRLRIAGYRCMSI